MGHRPRGGNLELFPCMRFSAPHHQFEPSQKWNVAPVAARHPIHVFAPSSKAKLKNQTLLKGHHEIQESQFQFHRYVNVFVEKMWTYELSPKQHEGDDQIQNLFAKSNHRSVFLTDIYVSCHHWKFETTRRRFGNSQFQHVDKCLHWLGINHCHQRTWWSSIFRPCEFGNQDLSILLFRFRVTHSMLALEIKGWSHHLISLTPRSVSKGYQKHLFVGPMEIQNYCAKKKSHMWALHWSKKEVMFNAIGALGTFMQFPPSGFPRKGLTLNECIMNTSVVLRPCQREQSW